MDDQKKELFILRQAKSSWSSGIATDFDRPLNERGVSDAPKIAKAFAERTQRVDQILCSASRRTRETADFFLNAFDASNQPTLTYSEALYGAAPETLSEEVASAPDSTTSILVIAHNPGLTEWVNRLHTPLSRDNLPTCGLVGLRFVAPSWNVVLSRLESELIFYITPKSLT